MLWQTVQFLVHVKKRIADDSFVVMPAASSMLTVLEQQSCEDRDGLCVLLEWQDHRMQPSTSTNSRGSRRPVDTQCHCHTDYRRHSKTL